MISWGQYGTNSQTSEDYVRACEAQGIGPNILALTEPVADPSKEELVIEIARELYDRFVMGGDTRLTRPLVKRDYENLSNMSGS